MRLASGAMINFFAGKSVHLDISVESALENCQASIFRIIVTSVTS